MNHQQVEPFEAIMQAYKSLVASRYPTDVGRWPLVSGANVEYASYNGWTVVFIRHTGIIGMRHSSGRGELPRAAVDVDLIMAENLEGVRERLLQYFRATLHDALVLVPPSGYLPNSELEIMMARNEAALGLAKMKIFLSHKNPDKTMVRGFKTTLEALGFDPWLDEDAMPAGAQLDRAILKGMQDSCAAVFFLTPSFEDATFLATEINYAIAQQRSRPQQFSIISLILKEDGRRPEVPELLKTFVWKEPRSHLEALHEIVRALPIRLGPPRWR